MHTWSDPVDFLEQKWRFDKYTVLDTDFALLSHSRTEMIEVYQPWRNVNAILRS